MNTDSPYQLVKVASGDWSLRSHAHGETFHPVIGPVAEAEALFVKQLNIRKRVADCSNRFIIWDVGLGAAANPITALKAVEDLPKAVEVISFDNTLEPLQFALQNTNELSYLQGFESMLQQLIQDRKCSFRMAGGLNVEWNAHVADFPSLLHSPALEKWPKPHAILFDAFSPAKNAPMWSYNVFSRLFQLLDPQTPCAMPTYSRSTMLRVTLLLAGFYVGAGQATGEKEETTIAANSLSLLSEPLTRDWLNRARNSTSAEPMWEGVYRQAPLSERSWLRLLSHPQFAPP